MKSILFILLMLSFASCSGSKSTSVESKDAGIELADTEEFSDSGTEDVVAGNMDMSPINEEPMMDSQASAPQIEPTGEEAVYTVQKNETLMIIAFKIYGDYGKWKELSSLNGTSNIKEGMQLKYNKPASEFVWAPAGNPHLIKNGETLGTISNDTYGTKKHWKDIWTNNKPLIKDPNKIFAGFTIFTPVIEGRDVANNDLSDL